MDGRGGRIAREISYAGSARTRAGQALIRATENATGRLRLIRRARGFEAEVAAGRDFWEVVAGRYGLSLDVRAGALDRVPGEGPLVVIANHPYGILDGLMLGYLMARTRGDFRILAHRVFRRAEVLERVILPVDFDETRAAQRTNLATRAEALRHLAQGGCVGIFPGGTVSTAPRPFGRALDPAWRNFTAKMVLRSGATVLPVFFEGENSRMFQMASHLHYTLRMALLVKEFGARVDRPVGLRIGAPLGPEVTGAFRNDPAGLMDFLRRTTYALSPEPGFGDRLGHEFEARYRRAG